MPGAPATTVSRAGEATAAALAAHLVAAPSVTAGLLAWCEAHGIGEGPIAVLARAGGRPPPGLVSLLGAAEDEALGYRRVVLGRGGIALAEAELVFRAGALTEEMREAVRRGTLPFGTIVAPLSPRRETLSQEIAEGQGAPPLRLRALLRLASGAPLAAVEEEFLPVLLMPHRSATGRP